MRNCSHWVSTALMLTACVSAHASRQGHEKLKTETRVEKSSIPSVIQYQFSRSVGAGRLIMAHSGKPGYVKKTYRVKLQGKKVVTKELLKEETAAAEPTLFLMGRAGYMVTSRGSFTRGRVLTMRATAYDPSPATIGPGATGRTRTGMRADFGVVAVDPRVIPLGTLVFVEGYGFAIASDTGSAIKGNRIDLCYASKRVADSYGSRLVKVHIFKNR